MELSDEISPSLILANIIFNAILFTFHASILFLYYRRRHLFPICGSDPMLVISLFLFTFLTRFSEMVMFLQNFPCIVSGALRNIANSASIFLYLLRAWTLLYRFEVTALLMDVNQQKVDSGALITNWYVRHRYLIRPATLALFTAINIIFTLTYVTFDLSKGGKFCPLEYISRTVSTFSKFHLVGMIIVALCLAYKLYKVKGDDNFGVKHELKIVAANGVFWQVLTVIYQGIAGTEATIRSGYDSWYRVAVLAPTIYYSLLKPLYLSYRFEQQTDPNSLLNMSLEELLTQEEGKKSFLLFLKKEFSTENLLYYLHVKDWLELAQKHPMLHPSCDDPSLSPRTRTTFFPSSISISPPSTNSPPLSAAPLPSLTFDEPPTPTSQQRSGSLPTELKDLNPTPTSHSTIPPATTTPSSHFILPIDSPSGEDGGIGHTSLEVELIQQAYALVENYLGVTACFSVNLSDKTRKKAIYAIASYGNSGQSLDTFKELIAALEESKKEIFRLMETDSYRRYLNSSEFETYRQQYAKSHLPASLNNKLHHLSFIQEEVEKANSKYSKGSRGGGGGSVGGEGGGGGGLGGSSIESSSRRLASPSSGPDLGWLKDESQRGGGEDISQRGDVSQRGEASPRGGEHVLTEVEEEEAGGLMIIEEGKDGSTEVVLDELQRERIFGTV